MQAFVREAGDPDVELGEWLQHGAPTGVANDVKGVGIFPQTLPKGEQHEDIWQFWVRIEPTAKYASVHENEDLVKQEIKRLSEKGFVTIYKNWGEVLKKFGNVVVSKMAAVVKPKEDGTTKLRIIIDMLRSRVNEHVRLHERIVLPRLQDLVADALAITDCTGTEDLVDMMVVDWADAFHSMGVLDDEKAHQIVKGFGDEFIGYETVLFGGGGSPGVWGRAAAFLGRSGQALFRADEARLQVYVDDPWSVWHGLQEIRRRNRAVLLLWWMALGPPLSWKKVQVGRQVKWIGAVVCLRREHTVLSLDEGFIKDLLGDVEAILQDVWVNVSIVKKLAGKAEWAAGIIPYMKPIISPLYAAAADAPGGRVGTKRIAHTLRWLRAFLRRQRGVLERAYHPKDSYEERSLILEFDASPWGYGGVLYRDGVPVFWFAEAISKEDVERFKIDIGNPKGQALAETIVIVIGLRAWAGFIGTKLLAIYLRSDSRAALGAALRLRSRDPRMNTVVRELALDLAEGRYDVDLVKLIPSKNNMFADAQSRW